MASASMHHATNQDIMDTHVPNSPAIALKRKMDNQVRQQDASTSYHQKGKS